MGILDYSSSAFSRRDSGAYDRGQTVASMQIVEGGCRCGNISYVAEFSQELRVYTPRACDCEFCRSHGAAYVSDKAGALTLKIKNKEEFDKYRQGSRIADFLICRNCGVMVGVCYEDGGRVYGSINIRSCGECDLFGDSKEMALAELSDEDRVKRWKENWFSPVEIEYEAV
jgi:hypothetical protein